MPIKRIMLPDTLGILDPVQTTEFISELVETNPGVHFDFHGHNDYGLATANSLAAAKAGAAGLHVTVNGLGERAGNSPLDEVVVGLRDLAKLENSVEEKALFEAARVVQAYSGRHLAPNKPICGSAVFTQTAGIHADGDKKGDLYITNLCAERFNRKRTYALGKLAGKASLDINLDKMGISLDADSKRKVLERVISLGDQKRIVTEDDLPFIVSDVLESTDKKVFEIVDCVITTTRHMMPSATIKVRYHDQTRQLAASGDGGYDSFMTALKMIMEEFEVELPVLTDYEVHIPPGGKTDALVQTTITWSNGQKTRGVHSDQVTAAIEATEHMLNKLLEDAAE